MRTLSVILFTILAALASAQDQSPVEPKSLPAPDQAVEPVSPSVKKLDATRFQVGEVIFDQKSREIRFPAQINMTEGLLEFLVVHQNGKIHESLLSTQISPTHLNLAFTLLRFPASKELYLLPTESGAASDQYPEVPAEVKAAARVTIEVEWEDHGKTRRIPVNEWIQHAVKSTAMPAGPWVYGGSIFENGQFTAESSGDIAAIFLSMQAIINYPGEDHTDDTVWTPFPKRVPPQGTNVTVIIAPYSKSKPLSNP